LLRAFAARLDAGAQAAQAHYGVRNKNESWRTRLMVIALSLFHGVRSIARERLRVSAGLRGNGMVFTTKVLAEVPHQAFSIVEDVEYGIRLARNGHRVWYVDDAEVLGEMAAGEQASRTQRERWEVGRLQMARQFGLPLLRDGIRQRSLMLCDLAADLLVPPLSYVVAAAVLGLGVAATVAWSTDSTWLVAPFAVSVLMLTAYVLRGIQLANVGLRGFVDLLYAPGYMVWKYLLAVRGKRTSQEWVRTRRSDEGP
jgi:cellulose synthase/poly-beta-1,6-N-acetylglucosamine synthase-like glycosyltransferase